MRTGHASGADARAGVVAERMRLGSLVLKPGERVSVVLRDNRRGEWLTLAAAARSGCAYMGEVDDDVLPLDCDPSERPEATRGLALVIKALSRHAIQPVVIDSGRDGHAHLFARVPDPGLLTELKTLARGSGLGVRSVIRLPLSPHRAGLTVRLRSPETVDEAAAALARPVRRPLSPAMQQALTAGVSAHISPSDRLQALCTAMIQAAWTDAEAYRALRANPGGKTLRRVEGEGRDPHEYFLNSWRTAAEFVRERPALPGPQEVVVELIIMRERVQRQQWHGTQGATQRMVLTALIDLALKVGTVEVNASERQLVELTGRSTTKSIRAALKALRQDGWLRRTRVGTGRKGSSYRLHVERGVTETPPDTSLATPAWGGVRPSDEVLLTHDTFARGGGIGVSAARVYGALSETWSTTAVLSELAGLPPRTVQRALRALETRELAEELSRTWRKGPADVDDVALRRGSAGAGADLQERHRQERAAFRGYEITPAGKRTYIVQDATEKSLCAGETAAGRPCRAFAVRGTEHCVRHGQVPEVKPMSAVPSCCPADLTWAADLERELAQEHQAP